MEKKLTPVRKILILTANPKDTARLRLDQEVREIDEGLRLAKNREQFEIEQQWATRLKDLRRALLNYEPHIVHFCGHGENDGLILENMMGEGQLVEPEALADLFALFTKQVECVVLNACYSERQADAIARHIRYVIGMNKAIGDKAAVEFAVGFYDAIGAGRSVEEAYKFGCTAIRMEGLPEHLTPVLKTSVAAPKPVSASVSATTPECSEWREEDWSDLIADLRRQNCLLILGENAAVVNENGREQPLTEILTQELAQEISMRHPEFQAWNLDATNLPRIAQCYALSKERTALETKVETFYRNWQNESNQVYQELAQLPFYLTVTTTPDNLFAQALRNAKKTPTIASYHPNGRPTDIGREPTVDAPLVFHLYGEFQEMDMMVLTETDLLDFLVAVSANTPSLPKYILSELRNKNKNLLFLGFGFQHWYKRILLHVLEGGNPKPRRSFALERLTSVNLADFNQTALLFKKSDYNIHICQRELAGFVTELRTRYEASLAATPVSSGTAQAARAVNILIYHAPADAPTAENIYAQLAPAGFVPWRERDMLRTKPLDLERLKNAINQELEYIILLQSQALANSDDGMLDVVLKLALDRQTAFKPGVCFLIPVLRTAGEGLEEVEHLRTVNIAHNLDELIQLLQRDQQKRLKGR